MMSVIAIEVCTTIRCIATLSAGHIGRLRCQPPPEWWDYVYTCACMLVVIGLLVANVTATSDLKIGPIRLAEMCSAT